MNKLLTKQISATVHVQAEVLVATVLNLMEYLLCYLFQEISLVVHRIRHIILLRLRLLHSNRLIFLTGNFFFLSDFNGSITTRRLILRGSESTALIGLLADGHLLNLHGLIQRGALVGHGLVVGARANLIVGTVIVEEGGAHGHVLVGCCSIGCERGPFFVLHFDVLVCLGVNLLRGLSSRARVNLIGLRW